MRLACCLLLASLLLSACAGGYNRPIQLLEAVGPVYPPEARAAGVEGEVVVRYDLTAEGVVHNLRVVSATPPDVFDQAAMDAVAQWRYRPRYRNGVAEAVQNIESRVNFTTGRGEAYRDL